MSSPAFCDARPAGFRVRRSRAAFTLIELLVVLAIVAMLVAMLLPALAEARFQAVRMTCLKDRQQNYLSAQRHTDDHNGYMPENIDALAHGGYVGDAEMMFCPAFKRPRGDIGPGLDIEQWWYDQPAFIKRSKQQQDVPWQWDESQGYMQGLSVSINPNVWHEEVVGGSKSIGTGVEMCTVYGGFFHTDKLLASEIRFSYLAKNWNTNSVTPYWLACANYRTGQAPPSFKNRFDDDPKEGKSHESRGLNSASYDGSVRWFGLDDFLAEDRGPRALRTFPPGAWGSNDGLFWSYGRSFFAPGAPAPTKLN